MYCIYLSVLIMMLPAMFLKNAMFNPNSTFFIVIAKHNAKIGYKPLFTNISGDNVLNKAF